MLFSINPENPHQRLIERVVDILKAGGLIAYPTDTYYGIGCDIMNKRAIEKIYQLKQSNKNQPFRFICADLKNISRYAKVSNWAHRLIRQLTPGPYTFVLPATTQVPRNHKNKRPATIGIRIPDHLIVQSILDAIDEPILSSSLILPDMAEDIYDAEDLYDTVHLDIDLFVDAGYCPMEPTTVLDLTGQSPAVLRQGKGVIDF